MQEFDSINASNVCISANPIRTGPAIPCTKQVGLNGSLHVSSASLFGDPTCFPAPAVITGNVMIGRSADLQAKILPMLVVGGEVPISPPTPTDIVLGTPQCIVGISVNSQIINVLNATVINITSPITNGVGAFNWVGTKTLTGASAETGALVETGAQVQAAQESRSGAKVINGSTVINGALVVNGATHINGFLSFTGSIVGIIKKFDIPHPTKSNHRLSHVCLEGPEAGVYYRGKLKDNNVIELPEYWRGLVDAETITVNLTPHGCYQELFVKAIEWGTIITIVNNLGGPINCSYTVFGKRKDVPDLVVEYEGNEIIEN
jgi:cytoskeletal protein CcmA (bactofilin family)